VFDVQGARRFLVGVQQVQHACADAPARSKQRVVDRRTRPAPSNHERHRRVGRNLRGVVGREREHQRLARRRVRLRQHGRVVDRLQQRRLQHRLRRPLRHEPARLHQRDVVGVLAGKVQVVQHDQDADAPLVGVLAQGVHQARLVAQV
jgi:hypothetical protein